MNCRLIQFFVLDGLDVITTVALFGIVVGSGTDWEEFFFPVPDVTTTVWEPSPVLKAYGSGVDWGEVFFPVLDVTATVALVGIVVGSEADWVGEADLDWQKAVVVMAPTKSPATRKRVITKGVFMR